MNFRHQPVERGHLRRKPVRLRRVRLDHLVQPASVLQFESGFQRFPYRFIERGVHVRQSQHLVVGQRIILDVRPGRLHKVPHRRHLHIVGRPVIARVFIVPLVGGEQFRQFHAVVRIEGKTVNRFLSVRIFRLEGIEKILMDEVFCTVRTLSHRGKRQDIPCRHPLFCYYYIVHSLSHLFFPFPLQTSSSTFSSSASSSVRSAS